MNKTKEPQELIDSENHEGFQPGREHLALLSVAAKKEINITLKKSSNKKLDTTLMGLYLSL